ncbi:hypothetical protein [Roseicyclus mahoneyensis]|jgi:hypothetical protein|uniref:hypothetical protein n=1 Tax=Roseicyclus mahoneyensis TaxID=164332 RepID=UPI0014749194|nr:hypothetical protein [Roseicyclus mahoneyensis]
MRSLILASALSLAIVPASAQTVPTVPSQFPAPGIFCGFVTLRTSAAPVSRDARG